VLIMDEACLACNGILSTHNQHTWTDESVCSFSKQQFQQQLVVNIWIGVIGEQSHPRSLRATASAIISLLFTVSMWTVTTVTGWCTNCTAPDSLGAARWDWFLPALLGMFYSIYMSVVQLLDRAKQMSCVASTITCS
jgi:hypothetical protein